MPVDRSRAGAARDRVRPTQVPAWPADATAAGIAVVSAADAAAQRAALELGELATQDDSDVVPPGAITSSGLTIAADRLAGRDTASSGAIEEIAVSGGLEFSGSGGIQRSALTGDVTASAGSGTTAIASNAVTTAKIANANVTLAKLATQDNHTILGNVSGSTASPSAYLIGDLSEAGIDDEMKFLVEDSGGRQRKCTLAELRTYLGL